jgi:hypothetical protein
MGWTSIYQLFWGAPGVQGFDTLPYFTPQNQELPGSKGPTFPRRPQRGWNELVDSAALALVQLGKSHATTWATQMKKAAPAARFAIDPACCGFHGKNPDGNSCDPRMVSWSYKKGVHHSITWFLTGCWSTLRTSIFANFRKFELTTMIGACIICI